MTEDFESETFGNRGIYVCTFEFLNISWIAERKWLWIEFLSFRINDHNWQTFYLNRNTEFFPFAFDVCHLRQLARWIRYRRILSDYDER